MAEGESSPVGALLRGARKGSHLSQSEVARRAGVAQSVVSAYESGRREPSLSMLQRLIAAAGHRMVIQLERDSSEPSGLPDTPLGRRLRHRRKAVLACAGRHGATNMRVFGSVARGEDRPESDVDLVVDLAPRTGLFELGALKRELSQILGVPVDVAPSDSLRPKVRAEIEQEGVPL